MLGKSILAIAAGAWMVAPALAGDHKIKMPHHSADKMMHGKVMVKTPWARASIGKNGAAYVTVLNFGNTADNLIGAAAPVAKRVELHTHKNDNGIMRMRHIKSIPVPANGSVTLKPGGHHIMMMGLTKKLKNGEEFPLTLTFKNAGKVTVDVKIRHAGALGNPAGHDHKKMDGMGYGNHKMKH